MEDIVAIAVTLESGATRYFLTWGRIQDPTDPTSLETLVLRQSVGFSLGGTPVAACICTSLQEAAHEPYFYEGLIWLAQEKIPFGPRYEAWRKNKAEEMAKGKSLYYLGPRDPPT